MINTSDMKIPNESEPLTTDVKFTASKLRLNEIII